ncbi:MAG TPA: lysophospholipid acyltransferase family protein [Actinomycetaceae bacterium]|nr:lysophospholipid acyltransferase family protein [Actinomycetaceae bacterium]
MRMKPAEGRTVPAGYRFARAVLRPVIMRLTERHWAGSENLPPEGAYIAVANHVTNADPITFAHYMVDHDVPVKILTKSELFEVPIFRRVITSAGMIPVERGTKKAGDSLAAAKEALARGEVIGIFPEGTLTHDPDGWPMHGKTGAARLALESGVPVIPIAQWGAHRLMPRHSGRLVTLKPQRVDVVAGPPVDLSDFADQPLTGTVLREATDRIMHQLRGMLGEIRGETPPEHVWNIRIDGDMREALKAESAKIRADQRADSLLGRVLGRLGLRREHIS